MNLFLWTMIVLLSLSAVGKLIWLATGKFPVRKPSQAAWDVAIDAAIVCWAVVLLATT